MSHDATTVAPGALDLRLKEAEQLLQSDLEQAVDLASQIVVDAQAMGDEDCRASALNVRAWANYGLGETVAALSDHLAALQRQTVSGDEVGIGRSLHGLGAVHGTIGDSSAALENYERALAIQSRIGDQWGEARTRNGLAIVLAEGRHYEEANDAFREVARLFTAAGDVRWVHLANVNRCVTQVEQAQSGEISQAQGHALMLATVAECIEVQQAAETLGPSGRMIKIYSLQAQARALLELDEPGKALEVLRRTRPVADQAKDVAVQIEIETHTARALEALGRPETVFHHLDRAEELALGAGRDRHLGLALQVRANLCEGRGDLAAALAAHRRFHEIETKAKTHTNALRAQVIRSLLDAQQAELNLAVAQASVEALENAHEERKSMVSAIAHELRNPITTVLGLSDEMCRTWDQIGDDGLELMTMIREEAGDLASIVEDLLTAASIERDGLKATPQNCDLESMVAAVIARSRLDGKTARYSGTGSAYVDPARFRQILRNLVSNAVRYGGDEILVTVEEKAHVTAIEVRDDGSGIAKDEWESVFEPFQRGKGVLHGAGSTGLGLAVTRDLARLMGGDICYRYTGAESVFCLTLPSPQ